MHRTTRGLRASIISALINTGNQNSSSILRTRHNSVDILSRYHKLNIVKVIRHQFSAFSSTFTTIPFSHIELDALRSEMDACKSNHTSSNHPNSSDTLVFVYSKGSFKGYFKTVTKPFIAIYRKSGRVCNVTSPTP